MFTQQVKSLPDKLSIYTWNPPWETFRHLSLEKKIDALKQFVFDSQADYQNRNKEKDPDSVCMIVAPDEIFNPSDTNKVYSFKEKKFLDEQLTLSWPLITWIKEKPDIDPFYPTSNLKTPEYLLGII